ncbi:hypothetical protein WOLCODRAFT_73866 [Wolfiporia cocos MD-104 SS10]|uniref:Uncharacterized protein n=1 Tax=Wolfiporia cocos (strain MD-104) TaxID=742152 RepID=A0A2H3JL69_WOLCO|nr:hypothetical protein WOLCODRAFT_73866 [Wolfiporia cocos MD-104 SS10]
MPSSYTPDETSTQLFAEKAWLQGALFSNIVYGIEVSLFFQCFRVLLQGTNQRNRTRRAVLLVFITTLFTLGTIFVYSMSEYTQLAFIQNRNYPGGPSAYEEAMFWIPENMIGTAVFVIGNWLMDMLLASIWQLLLWTLQTHVHQVWRCYVIHLGVSRIPAWAVMILPCLNLLASFVLGTLFLAKSATSSPFLAVDVSLAYFSATLCLNVFVTILIVARLLYHRRRLSQFLDAAQTSHYASLAAILVESASLYSAFLVFFIVPFALNNPLSAVPFQSMGQVQTVTSFLIILRIAEGRSWSGRITSPVAYSGSHTAIRLSEISVPQFTASQASDAPIRAKVDIAIVREVFIDHEELDGKAPETP